MKKAILFSTLSLILVSACIKDDFIDDQVEPSLSITSLVDTLAINTEFQFESRYLNNIGLEEKIAVSWSSSDNSILGITTDGLATATNIGSVTIIVKSLELDPELSDTLIVEVGNETIISVNSFSGTIITTSSYALEGSFVMEETDQGIIIEIGSDYKASTALPGLYVYLSNNRNSVANAYEIDKVRTFSGAHNYDLPGIEFNEYNYLVYYCKPFNIKVGEATLN